MQPFVHYTITPQGQYVRGQTLDGPPVAPNQHLDSGTNVVIKPEPDYFRSLVATGQTRPKAKTLILSPGPPPPHKKKRKERDHKNKESGKLGTTRLHHPAGSLSACTTRLRVHRPSQVGCCHSLQGLKVQGIGMQSLGEKRKAKAITELAGWMDHQRNTGRMMPL